MTLLDLFRRIPQKREPKRVEPQPAPELRLVKPAKVEHEPAKPERSTLEPSTPARLIPWEERAKSIRIAELFERSQR